MWFFSVTGFLMQWGWYLLFGTIALLYIRYKLDPYILSWVRRRREDYLNRFGESRGCGGGGQPVFRISPNCGSLCLVSFRSVTCETACFHP